MLLGKTRIETPQKTFKIFNLLKNYYSFSYRKNQKTLIILNRKNKLENLFSSNRKRIYKSLIIHDRKIKSGKNKINEEKYIFSNKKLLHQFLRVERNSSSSLHLIKKIFSTINNICMGYTIMDLQHLCADCLFNYRSLTQYLYMSCSWVSLLEFLITLIDTKRSNSKKK